MLQYNDSLSLMSAEEQLKGKAVNISRIVEGLDRAQEIRRVINAPLIFCRYTCFEDREVTGGARERITLQ